MLMNFHACTSAPRYAGSSTPKVSKSKKEKALKSSISLKEEAKKLWGL